MDYAVEQILFCLAMAAVATAYAALGQGGATGYIAVMGIVGLSPNIIRPTALILNVLVAGIGTAQFARTGLLSWRNFYPFALLGVPCSLLGGALHLPAFVYRPVVGCLLLLAAWQMAQSVWRSQGVAEAAGALPPLWFSIFAGAGIGFVAGVTGIGGGILLAPLLLGLNWSSSRHTAAVSAAFNLVNSAAALLGLWANHYSLPLPSPWWLGAVACGGVVGSWLSIRRLPTWVLRYGLAVLLVIAGARMLWTQA